MSTEWIISGNPAKYDVIRAFQELGTVDWTQSSNVQEGDTVYIYISNTVRSIKFKCIANAVDKVTPTIEDQKFNISGEYDGSAGRYMELEMVKEFESELFDLNVLENYGFKAPMGPIRVNAELKMYLDLVQSLITNEEIIPDQHDGSYELMREVINAYAVAGNSNEWDYKDLNLVYLSSVISSRHGFEAKIQVIKDSHLPETQKTRLIEVINGIWNKVQGSRYIGKDTLTLGMFGTGFMSFQGKANDDSVRKFIKMCIDIKDLSDDTQIFDICDEVLTPGVDGMGAAAASMVLHCLKPTTFPIFNGNMGNKNIYEYFGLAIKYKGKVESYISNCRLVKEFRDKHFGFKNYRVLDLAARSINTLQGTDIDYLGVLDYLENNLEVPYSNPEADGLSQAQKDHLLEIKQRGQDAVSEMKKMVSICKDKFALDKCEPLSWLDGSNTKTRKYLWAQMKKSAYGDNPISITLFAEMSDLKKSRYRVALEIKNDSSDSKQMKKYHSFTDLPIKLDSFLVYMSGSNLYGRPEILDKTREEVKQGIEDGTYKKVQLCRIIEWTDELTNDDCEQQILEAVEELMPYYKYVIDDIKGDDVLDFNQEKAGGQKIMNVEFDKNLILYGPPGTGKTYNSVIYAVAICENKSLMEVAQEDYTEVKERFDALMMKDKRIAFTTFHQSYGYEEFIEGIKPITKDGNVTYDVIPGVFKEFCDKAGDEIVEDSPITFSDDVTVWKVTIKDGSLNDVKKDCFENGRVRIGWDQNPSDENGQRCVRNMSQDMQVGDVILSFKTNRSIDAIGVVNDAGYAWLEDEGDYKNSLGVDWLVTNIDEDILDINGGKIFTRTTVHKVAGIKPADIVKILKKCSSAYASVSVKKNEENYVFVIDEINRGNISKIFGELITLIENTKRAGMDEEASAILPYSGKEFYVPSNVYILGTMNTADRSIALMDTALRRRFQFVEMMPDADLLDDVEIDGLNIGKMLRTINRRIEFLYDREHTIGHAFFMGLKADPSIEKLASIFSKSVIPLLQEYFYEDYQKIQLVLGDNAKKDDDIKFIKDEKVVAKDIFVGNVEDVIDLPEKSYSINSEALLNIESYKMIAPEQ